MSTNKLMVIPLVLIAGCGNWWHYFVHYFHSVILLWLNKNAIHVYIKLLAEWVGYFMVHYYLIGKKTISLFAQVCVCVFNTYAWLVHIYEHILIYVKFFCSQYKFFIWWQNCVKPFFLVYFVWKILGKLMNDNKQECVTFESNIPHRNIPSASIKYSVLNEFQCFFVLRQGESKSWLTTWRWRRLQHKW